MGTIPFNLSLNSLSLNSTHLLDLSDQPQLEKLLSGVADIHLKQHLFRQKYVDRDVDAKSDYQAAKWREQADKELRFAAGESKALYRALVCYNLAIAYAEQNAVIPETTSEETTFEKPATSTASDTVECELSKAYLSRGELNIKHLARFEMGIRDLERAISASRSPVAEKRMHFLLLDYIVKEKDKLPDNCSKALELVSSIEDKFCASLSDDQKTSLVQFREVLEHQMALKSLNTINYNRKTLLQSLTSTHLPTIVEKDKPLVAKLLADPEKPLVALADAFHCEDGLFKLKEDSLKPSQLILLEQAFAHVNMTQYSHCAACLAPLHFFGALPCRACSGHLYCNANCESEDWDTFHQFECATAEKRSIWNRLDVLSKLATRMLLRFGNSWTLMVDSIREFFCNKINQFANKVQFEAKKTLQLRALLDWYKEQGPGGAGLKLSMTKFISQLGQAFGIFTLLHETMDMTKSPIILPEYRAKLLHGIVLCRILLEAALAAGIVGPILPNSFIREQQELQPFTVHDLVAKLKADKGGDENPDKILQELIEKERELGQNRDLTQSPPMTPIGLGLYPSNVFLKRVNNQPEITPNGTVVNSGTYRAIRSLRVIAKDHPIQVVLPKSETMLDGGVHSIDDEMIDQMAQNYVDEFEKADNNWVYDLKQNELNPEQMKALDCELSVLQSLARNMKTTYPIGLQVALFMDMSRANEQKGDFKAALNCVGKCLELTQAMTGERVEKLRQALMIRLCKMQFELFVGKELTTKESTTVAESCLVNCSQVIVKLEWACLPLRVHRALLYAKQNPKATESSVEISEQLIAAEGIHCLSELEEMMVASNMFSQQFQPGASPAGAAS